MVLLTLSIHIHIEIQQVWTRPFRFNGVASHILYKMINFCTRPCFILANSADPFIWVIPVCKVPAYWYQE